MEHLLRVYNSSSNSGKKFKFGVKVPKTRRQAMDIDKRNGNDGWKKFIKLELDQIMSYKVFKVWPDGVPLPPGYK